jgi:hypothetical protein
LLPGDIIGRTNDLVLTLSGNKSGIAALTLNKMGLGQSELMYSSMAFRQGECVFHNRLTFSSGAPVALWTWA